ncbi:uncharacterized protein LOC113776130 [Coffea eugenioides]|uniref:Mitochondrial import inner membrane translocase subunit TIM50 n=2 Tax=Coffea arabica TaxID=13443 RepID=A0ABM4UTQ6_COFAR|nr:uncharacterized protein LOC113776130 [Coffea eugenioides]
MAAKIQGMKLKNVVGDDDGSDGAADDLGGLSLEKLKLGPSKKLLVLCLGGLLAHRVHKRHSASVQGRRPDLVYGNFLVFKRPFCGEFLNFCFQRFEVGLWSSARERNMDYVLRFIMDDSVRRKVAFVWDQEECIDSGFRSLHKKQKPLFLKDLNKVWENKDRSLPWPSGKYSSSNTLLIDDEPCKALLNPPHTSIFPHPYKSDNCKDTFLGPKGELQVFLDGLADADEVPSYVKEHALGQPAITALHPDWGYSESVVRHFQRTKAALDR